MEKAQIDPKPASESKLALFLKFGPLWLATIAIFSIVVADFKAICAATSDLAARAGAVTNVELPGGVKLTISERQVRDILLPLNANYRKETAEAISRIQPEEFSRLMQVGQLADLCEYEKPDVRMRAYIAIDYALDEKKLVELTRNMKAVSMPVEDHGAARLCYDLRLTDLGNDVKSALVQSFKDAFATPRGQARPAPDSREMAAR